MSEAKQGDVVQVHYTGKLKDGTIFDTSQDRDPLEFTLGEGRVIPGFEDAVVGMEPNQSRIVTVPAEQAYGPRRDDLIMPVPRDQFPQDLNPQTGQQLEIRMQNGDSRIATVTEVSADDVTLDINHPLAGHDLTFDILLVGIA